MDPWACTPKCQPQVCEHDGEHWDRATNYVIEPIILHTVYNRTAYCHIRLILLARGARCFPSQPFLYGGQTTPPPHERAAFDNRRACRLHISITSSCFFCFMGCNKKSRTERNMRRIVSFPLQTKVGRITVWRRLSETNEVAVRRRKNECSLSGKH